jgi:hypothetical protein
MWEPFKETPVESQARLIELNLLGAINDSHAALPHFFERGGRFLFRSGLPAADSDGGLFGTVEGRAEARGGWGVPQRRRARRAAAVGVGLNAGASAVLIPRARRAANGGRR